VLALTLGLVVVLARIAWNDPFKYFGFMATTATFAILGAYILIAVAGMVFFWRSRGTTGTAYNILLDVVLPLGAVAICGYTIYESFRAPGPSPNTWSPWIALAWLAAGCVVLAWLRATHPGRVQSFGSILAAGEGAAAGGGAVGAAPPM
jgi:amino acid transporter